MNYAKPLLLTLMLSLACTRTDDGTRPGMNVSYDEFIRIMVELKSSPPGQKAAILKRNRTTEAELQKFVTTHARNPALLSAVFDSVQVRLDRKRSSGE